MLAIESSTYADGSTPLLLPDDHFHVVDPQSHSTTTDRGVPEATATGFEEILLATLSRPQRVRYCYTCWGPGHYSAECPLIPKGKRDAIAKRRAELMRTRPPRFTSSSPSSGSEFVSTAEPENHAPTTVNPIE
jgi:Zinc knuckle